MCEDDETSSQRMIRNLRDQGREVSFCTLDMIRSLRDQWQNHI